MERITKTILSNFLSDLNNFIIKEPIDFKKTSDEKKRTE